MKNKEKITEAFHKVKALKWIRSHRKNNTGIGKTFEDCIGVIENNLKEPDLYGFEIKAHRNESSSYVTLFTKSPSFPKRGANAMLKDRFGEQYPDRNMKKLHTSIFANSYNNYKGKYSFRLIHKPQEKRIYIGVYTLNGAEELDCSVYYTYKDIERVLAEKLHNLLYVKAQRKFNNDCSESFYFESAEIYMNPSLSNFLHMLDNGEIMYDIRIGAYGSGKNIGKPHDHGSGFRIKENNISKLYSYFEEIK